MRVRNHLYNTGYYKSFEFQTNVISVGNLTVGGTGKTPMVEYLIKLLKSEYKVATLSRGYGRKTRGFLKGDLATMKVKDVGDEPYQYLLKFKENTDVFVGEERAWAIPNILMESPETEIILMDDAYQHRTVKPSLNIVLSRHDQLFYKDFILPMGRLRESRKEIKRADAIVITKCPEETNQEEVKREIDKYLDGQQTPLFFTTVKYGDLIAYNDQSKLPSVNNFEMILISGIARASDFETYLKNIGVVKKHYQFGDHYRYSAGDIAKMRADLVKNKVIYVSTEKDYVKLREFKEELRDLPFYYLPIEIEFLNNKSNFDQLIRQSIRKYELTGNEDE